MHSKFRILTFHHIPNHGAFLFSYSLLKFFRDEFPKSEVKILDYKSTRLALFENLKRFKLLPRIPFYYYKRSQNWISFLKRFLDLDRNFPQFASEKKVQKFLASNYDLVIIGMDVWCLRKGTERPSFPNIYWLPEKMEIPKIAYAVSGYNSDLSLIQQHQGAIARYLNDFDVIGSRDRFTHEMVLKHRTRKDGLVERIPDPAFLYDHQTTEIKKNLSLFGINVNRPILGLLLYGNQVLSREIKNYYHAKGYQILALSMYNPSADFNLGHLLSPFEWAEVFRYLTFCITDRFHGAIFCIKSGIPFISLEKDFHLPLAQSKLHDLLTEFDLTDCYENTDSEKFSTQKFFSRVKEIEIAWEKHLRPIITPKLQSMTNRHREFIHKTKTVLNL